MGYYLSPKAEDDLITLFIHGAQHFGLAKAQDYHDELERLFEFLSDHPEASPARNVLGEGIRVHPHASHIVIYRIDDNRDVYVIRIRHAHEDWLIEK